jgi:hypothetical protein
MLNYWDDIQKKSPTAVLFFLTRKQQSNANILQDESFK